MDIVILLLVVSIENITVVRLASLRLWRLTRLADELRVADSVLSQNKLCVDFRLVAPFLVVHAAVLKRRGQLKDQGGL